MSTATVVWLVVVVVLAIAVTLLIFRARRRRAQASRRMGLPDLGALTDAGQDKVPTKSKTHQ